MRSLLLALLPAVLACDESATEPGPEPTSPATLAIGPDLLRLLPGDTLTLAAEVRDSAGTLLDGEVSWTSRDPEIATISSQGRIQAQATGWTVLRGSVQGNPSLRDSVWLGVSLRFDTLALGGDVACGITDTGDTYCWGHSWRVYDIMDLSGSGPWQVTHATPHYLTDDATALAIGLAHACRLTRTGVVYCWGGNGYGQLGIGPVGGTAPVITPEPLVAIGASFDNHFTCGRAASGRVFCWGFNEDLQLGVLDADIPEADRCYGPCSNRPVEVQGVRLATLSVGRWHVCGLDEAGAAYCWGYNEQGSLGLGTNTLAELPQAVQTSTRFSQIVAFQGTTHTWALTQDGELYQWGAGKTLPERVNTTLRFRWIGSAGCARTDAGELYCMQNDGDLAKIPSEVPFRSVVTGYGDRMCALSVAGAAYCWGLYEGQGFGTGLPPSEVPVMVAPPGPVPSLDGDQ